MNPLPVGLLLVATCLTAIPASAAEPIPVAVMEFASKGGVEQSQMDALGDMLATEIRGLGPYKVIGKNDIRTMLQLEEQKTLLGCQDDSCLAEIGGALGVRWVVVGNVSLFGDVFLLNIKLMDVEKVVVVKSIAKQIKGGQAALLASVSPAARELMVAVQGHLTGMAGSSEATPPGVDLQQSPTAAPAAMATWGHVTFWTGLGLAAFGGLSAGLASSAADRYEKGDLSAHERSQAWTGAMWAGFSAGAALMITGVVLWGLAPADPTPFTAGLAPTPGGVAVGLHFAW